MCFLGKEKYLFLNRFTYIFFQHVLFFKKKRCLIYSLNVLKVNELHVAKKNMNINK